ncbi:sulfatase family protein [Membranihabitans maritimus]|uniref:sulfatase family protein n=1 Tax=Membranihabitans maritimus TaxID=2904244 RepID=UPI001F39E47A|nr:sulfatase [Membranihabitans maritimus]
MVRFLLIIGAMITIYSAVSSQNVSQPNILWIIAEDMSQDLGCYGNNIVKTPNIDQLANSGMRFTNMFTTAGVCAPSRTAIATGMYQTTLGAMHMSYSEELKPDLPGGVRTIEDILEENGYQTLGMGKDHYLFSNDKSSFQYKDIDDLNGEKPFFAKVNSHYTHRDFDNDSVFPLDDRDLILPPYYPDVQSIREDWAAYYENVQLLDREVKEILDEFEAKGLLKNTIIFFFSDHGRPFLKGKYWTYDSGVRIPFSVYIPEEINFTQGYKQHSVSEQMLSAIDISATTLALAGVKKPDYMQGKVFLGSQIEAKRDYIFSSIDRISGTNFKTRAVRTKKYKYIKNFNNGRSILECTTEYAKAKYPGYHAVSILDHFNKLNGVEKSLVNPLPAEELYDLENDPHETVNLAYEEEFQVIRERLQTILTDWIGKIEDKGFEEDSLPVQKHFIDVRQNNKYRYAGERLRLYQKVKDDLKKEGKL